MVTVYIVTGEHASIPSVPTVSGETLPGRADIAKFFTRADAEKHAALSHGTWRKLAVEERQETDAEQHPAHTKRAPPREPIPTTNPFLASAPSATTATAAKTSSPPAKK